MASEHFTFRIREELREAAKERVMNDHRDVVGDGRRRRLTLSLILTKALEEYIETGRIPGDPPTIGGDDGDGDHNDVPRVA